MSGYAIAWVIIVAAAIGGAVVLHFWMRGTPVLLKSLLIGAALTFFLLPAPVPDYGGHVAPAFVVAVFELLFQTDGKPGTALRILGLGLVLIPGAIWAVQRFVLVGDRNKQDS